MTTTVTDTTDRVTFDRSEWSIDELYELAGQLSSDIASARKNTGRYNDLKPVADRFTAQAEWLTAEAADVQAEISRRLNR